VKLASRSEMKTGNLRSQLLAECLAQMDLVILLCNVLDALSNAHNSS
jgi:hypothetical protein